MNVLMVTSSYPKFPGDATAPFIESIARAVVARGHAVDLVLPHHPELRLDRAPMRLFPFRYAPGDRLAVWGYARSLESDLRVRREVYLLAPLVALSLRREVSRRLRERRYDALHVHWVVPNAVLVAGLARSRRVPLVVSLHGSDVFLAEERRLLGLLARRAFRLAGGVTACSEDLRRRALRLGAPADRARVVPYGVDLEAFSPEVAPADLRARLGLAEDTLLVLGVGRLVEKKGFACLIEAAARVPGVRVALAGDGDLRETLERRARELGAPVSFLGELGRAAVARAFAAADVVAVPSIVDRAGNVDGLPNTLLEALAAGRPVLASRVAGIPDVVADEENGLLVPPGDASSLARALLRLRASPELRRRLGEQARRTAVARLSWEATARAFEETYAQAAALDAR